ncbi:MAG TPA: hypothetical protein VGK20_05330 [Candidatus Binatia bacterium]|jgi:hypothetical protein
MQLSVHVIAALAVCSRLADVGTTYLVTPTLKLEANAIVRRFGWRFGALTVVLGLFAYVSPPFGIVIATMSFIVAAFNSSKILMARALGEDEMVEIGRRVFLATPPWPGLLYLVMPGIFIAVPAVMLLQFYPDASEWGYYFALGMLGYSLAVFVHYPVRFFRVRAQAKKAGR